jgi:predicted  nucleic acid-binding Zn-ribbon protein
VSSFGLASVCAQVSYGRAVIESCPDCGAERIASDMIGLNDHGAVILGVLSGCPSCGSRWTCAYCPTVIPSSDDLGAATGARIYHHLSDHVLTP